MIQPFWPALRWASPVWKQRNIMGYLVMLC